MPLPEGMTYDGGLYKQMPALVRDIKLNVSVVRTGPAQARRSQPGFCMPVLGL